MSLIFAITPLLCAVALTLYFRVREQSLENAECGWRLSFLHAATVHGLCVVAITEILSVFHLITFAAVWTAWLVILVITVLLTRSKLKQVERFPSLRIPRLEPLEATLLGGGIAIIACVGVVAIVSPPNNWDALSYHMSRVVHWAQNRSVAHYPTHIPRQLSTSPWTEFVILQLQVLTGGDRFASLVQWFNYAGCAVAASLLAWHFGANRRGQILAAIISITIPSGLLQGSTVKNDCAISFWLISFCFFLFRLKTSDNRLNRTMVGATLGLALLSKGTAYLFAFPFLIWLVGWSVGMYRLRAWKILLYIASVVVVINSMYYVRNLQLFGKPLGPGYDKPASAYDLAFIKYHPRGHLNYGNDEMTIPLLVSNLVRNLVLHAATPIPQVNDFLESTIRQLHRAIGVNLNDRRTTWHYSKFKLPPGLVFLDGQTSNPLHLILTISAVGYLFIRGRALPSRDPYWTATAIIAGFVLFSYVLRWHDTMSRLHLPLLILSAPLIVIVIQQVLPWKLCALLGLVLILSAYPWLLHNQNRPMVGPDNIFRVSRMDQYFKWRPVSQHYSEAIHFLESRNCKRLGLRLTWWNETEYQFWVLLKESMNSSFQIQHVDVENASATLSQSEPFKNFEPCAIVLLDPSRRFPDKVAANGKVYETTEVFASGIIRILLPE